MKALEFEFMLGSPIICPDGIMFDSLLAFWYCKKNKKKEMIWDFPLPIRKIKCGNDYFFDCSKSIIVEKNAQFTTLKKQINTRGMKKTINITSGKYCSNIATDREIQADSVKFYAYGDKDKILKLIADCNSIGKYRKNGKGIITEIKVKEVKMQNCIYDYTTKLLLRHIPFDRKYLKFNLYDCSWKLKTIRIRPPYNQSYNQHQAIPCLDAGSKIEIENFNKLDLIYT